MRKLLPLIFLFALSSIYAQNDFATLYGKVVDEKGFPVPYLNIQVAETSYGGQTDSAGFYKFRMPAGKALAVEYTTITHAPKTRYVNLSIDERRLLNVTLQNRAINIEIVNIESKAERREGLIKIDPEELEYIPNPSMGLGTFIKHQLGAGTSSELSDQYSIRGGNFDENLVYVNDFEIYRPFLVRSGQQEGLSFPNPDLISSLNFSSGGFQARYGDKLSSVLDVKYKRPTEFRGTIGLSLLGGHAHLEGVGPKKRFRYLFGLRQKSNQYLLNSLETKGEFNPTNTDLQLFTSYEFSEFWRAEFLGNYARNRFAFTPTTRQTEFGSFNEVIRFTVAFDGQEVDKYNNSMGGLALIHNPNENTRLKYMFSAYRMEESENFDIWGGYRLGEVETDLGSDDFGNEVSTLGVGIFQNWARNELTANIISAEHKGLHQTKKHYFQWGAKYQNEAIEDRINEWDRLDSAGFNLPYNPLSQNSIQFDNVLKSSNNLYSNRLSAFVQDSWVLHEDEDTDQELNLNIGARAAYWDVNDELVISPRMQIAYMPGWKRTDVSAEGDTSYYNRDVVFRLSGGLYAQQPFYRELRAFDGKLNRNVRAQKSIHVVLGYDYNFEIWDRPFKFVAEAYYKHLYDLIPYEIDNVLIRYFADNLSQGYAAGVDFRLNGEFVPGEESWFTMSFLKTAEDLENDSYEGLFDINGNQVNGDDPTVVADTQTIFPGYIPRLTDQRVTFGILFQDHLPNNKNFKMHLNLLFGTGLPFGPPDQLRFNDVGRIPPYRRVDIGFSALLADEKREYKSKNPLRKFKSIWVSAEVYNLLGVSNTVSYLWVKDVRNRTYAVPNFLTSRRLNVRMVAKF